MTTQNQGDYPPMEEFIMKKIITLIITLIFTLFPLTACKKDDNVLKINEVTDSFFYAPFYVAIEKGFFKEEGLDVTFVNTNGADKTMAALLSKDAQIEELTKMNIDLYQAIKKEANK